MSDDDREKMRAAAAGVPGWGAYADSTRHRRYSLLIPPLPGRPRRCSCGCSGRVTHSGMANGLAMMSGCELSVRRWVRDGDQSYATRGGR